MSLNFIEVGCEYGEHEYASKTCSHCGKVFCYNCCGSTNVDQGGKYQPDYMTCPACGHDFYAEVAGCANGAHSYATKTCSHCGQEFCYACCGSTNVDQGCKHTPDFMTCPVCGHDFYSEPE